MARVNLLLLVAVLLCAISAVGANHKARKIFIQLEGEQKRMRDLEVEWGQLQLEQSTWAAHARVEKIARERLAMRPPAGNQVMTVAAP